MFKLKESYLKGEINKAEYIAEMYKYHDNLYKYAKLLPQTNIKQIVIEDNLLYMKTRDCGIKLVCKEFDERIAPIEMLNFNNYEEDEWDIIDQMLNILEAKTFFDIGANIGYTSILMGKKHHQMVIHSFEPVKPSFDMLKINVNINNMENIQIHNIGLSDEKGESSFFYYPEGSVNASLENLSGREDVQEIICQIDTIDSMFTKLGEKNLDFIKCDVEGAEFMVLKGAKKTIADKKPVIFSELLRKWSKEFGYTPNDVINFMKNLNYKCYFIKNKKLEELTNIDEKTIETNFFFLNEEKHNKIKELMVNL